MSIVRIRIIGLGGQGIVFSGWLLSHAASLKNLYSSVYNSYGAEVRGGSVSTHVTISDKPIESPYTDTFDIDVLLHKVGWSKVSHAKLVIADDTLAKNGKKELNIEWLPFHIISVKEKLPINITVLGYLVKKIDFLDLDALVDAVKSRGINVEKNIMALKVGFELNPT